MVTNLCVSRISSFLLALGLVTSPFAQASGPKTVLGESLSPQKAVTVDQCVQQSSALAGKSVKVSGTVKQVCQQKGCWFVLTGKDGVDIRITSQGYKFFVPKNSAGKSATVEGKLNLKVLDVAMAQHYEDDRVQGTNEKPKKITEPVKELSIAATAVEIY